MVTARALRLSGYVIGTLFALAYLFMLWLSPLPDWQHMRPRSFMIVYVGFPLGIVFGTAWLFGWVAGRFDHKPPLED
jgi:MFS family permease